jgi:hypothetical protein
VGAFERCVARQLAAGPPAAATAGAQAAALGRAGAAGAAAPAATAAAAADGGATAGEDARWAAGRRCALLFESLGYEEEREFFHADQVGLGGGDCSRRRGGDAAGGVATPARVVCSWDSGRCDPAAPLCAGTGLSPGPPRRCVPVQGTEAVLAAAPPPNTRARAPHAPPPLSQAIRGLYDVFLEGWLALWPRDRTLVVRSEDWFERPRVVLSKVASFLGLPGDVSADDELWARLRAAEAHRPPNASVRAVPAAAAARADAFYTPHNLRLGQLLGVGPRSPWEGRRRPWRPSAAPQEGGDARQET